MSAGEGEVFGGGVLAVADAEVAVEVGDLDALAFVAAAVAALAPRGPGQFGSAHDCDAISSMSFSEAVRLSAAERNALHLRVHFLGHVVLGDLPVRFPRSPAAAMIGM